jgi:hypothetical protein
MRRATAFCVLALVPTIGVAGPIAEQFAGGWGGISFGTPLAALMGTLPEGDQYFSTAPGGRDYTIRSDEPILGVPRNGMRVRFHLDAQGTVGQIGITVPYERRDQLLGVMLSLFGPYRTQVIGISTHYSWPVDRGVQVAVRSSTNPANGILELAITGGRMLAELAPRSRCDTAKAPAASARAP